MSFFPFSFEHLPQYALLYSVLFLFLLADIQIYPMFLELNVLMISSLVIIYYWAIYHPRLLPVWMLFAAGLLKDLLSDMPLVGISAIIFIGAYLIVKQQRVFLSGQSFFMLWAGYIVLSILSCFIFWGLLCFYLFQIASLQAFAIECVVMVLSFPITFSIMGAIHRLLPFAPPDKTSL